MISVNQPARVARKNWRITFPHLAVRCVREALPAKNSFMVTDAKLVENLFEQGERLVSSACAPPARTIGCVTVSAQLALNQCPMFRFSRRTTRLPRYFAMSRTGISFGLA